MEHLGFVGYTLLNHHLYLLSPLRTDSALEHFSMLIQPFSPNRNVHSIQWSASWIVTLQSRRKDSCLQTYRDQLHMYIFRALSIVRTEADVKVHNASTQLPLA